jgi:hypothetical protein
MCESKEMVFSACTEWLQDWIDGDPPHLEDEWDAAEWMTHEMTAAIHMFIHNAFHGIRARNDAVIILRALCYEYFLFRQAAARAAVPALPDAPQRLTNALQTPQKSAAWHYESYDMLSGHEFGSIVAGGKAEYTAIVAKKCNPPEVVTGAPEQNIVFLTPPEGLSPFKWGWRYEPVARALFEMQFAGGVVFDGLGRLRHTSLPRLGASPDGIITTGPKVGRLVELKCPVSRQLTGSVPMDYWVQMQLQAEVCDVPAVEYFEVQLGSLQQTGPTHEGFENAARGSKLPWIGKVCVVAEDEDASSNAYRYEYSPLYSNSDIGIIECLAWKPAAGITLESALWWVRDYNTVTVLRNRRWWEAEGQPAYEEFWRTVSLARADGRYLRTAQPLFVDEPEMAASDRDSVGSAGDVGEQANDAAAEEEESAVEGWQGVESDHELETEIGAQHDSGSDLES